MAEKQIINTFVSHYHEDEEGIKGLKSLLGDNVTMKNSSVTSDKFNRANNPEYIKSLLRSRIDWASTVVCLIGPKTHDSEWVKYEIEYAHKKGKPIVGVFMRGSTDADLPDAVADYASAIVGWNEQSILKAFDGKGIFNNANGTSRPYGTGEAVRYTC